MGRRFCQQLQLLQPQPHWFQPQAFPLTRQPQLAVETVLSSQSVAGG